MQTLKPSNGFRLTNKTVVSRFKMLKFSSFHAYKCWSYSLVKILLQTVVFLRATTQHRCHLTRVLPHIHVMRAWNGTTVVMVRTNLTYPWFAETYNTNILLWRLSCDVITLTTDLIWLSHHNNLNAYIWEFTTFYYFIHFDKLFLYLAFLTLSFDAAFMRCINISKLTIHCCNVTLTKKKHPDTDHMSHFLEL